jgi:2-iminobutanoate/2-iminopropanoate deaminase
MLQGYEIVVSKYRFREEHGVMDVIQGEVAPIGPYSSAVKANGYLHISGQIGLDSQTGELISNDFEAQVKQMLANLCQLLEVAELKPCDLVKMTVFLVDMNDYPRLNECMMTVLSEPYPARSVVAVSALPKGALVEVEAIALLPS